MYNIIEYHTPETDWTVVASSEMLCTSGTMESIEYDDWFAEPDGDA